MGFKEEKELEKIIDQKAFSAVEIEGDCDHMEDFETFLDCFWIKILSIRHHSVDQAIVLRIKSMSQGKEVEDIFYYHPSLGTGPLRTQFQKKYHPNDEI
jgi:hypothetical protein